MVGITSSDDFHVSLAENLLTPLIATGKTVYRTRHIQIYAHVLGRQSKYYLTPLGGDFPSIIMLRVHVTLRLSVKCLAFAKPPQRLVKGGKIL